MAKVALSNAAVARLAIVTILYKNALIFVLTIMVRAMSTAVALVNRLQFNRDIVENVTASIDK